MIGALFGDIVGSIYEWDNIKRTDFPMYSHNAYFTDDSVMTCAIAKALMEADLSDSESVKKQTIDWMRRIGQHYPDCGYGGRFYHWMFSATPTPYDSYGNGSAMRVSPVGWVASSLEEALQLAKLVSEVTHNHLEGIKGAQATATAIYLSRTQHSKLEIKKYIEEYFYDLPLSCDEIRPNYQFNESCQQTVPQAIVAFLESNDFEHAIRLAISLGGDSDTLAAITGSIAEAYYGIGEDVRKHVMEKLNPQLNEIVCQFDVYLKGVRR